jgi:hypothetical protein
MTCICAKEVLFFGAESRDTSQLLYLLLTVHKHDFIGLKNRRFCPVENDRKGKNGLRPESPLIALDKLISSGFDSPPVVMGSILSKCK